MLRMILLVPLWWLYYVLIICFIGAVLGVLSHTLFGLLFQEQPDYGKLASFGFMNGIQYGGVWAGGASFVICFVRGRKEYLRLQGESDESAS